MSENPFLNQKSYQNHQESCINSQILSASQVLLQSNYNNQYKPNKTIIANSNPSQSEYQPKSEIEPKKIELFLIVKVKSPETEDRAEQMKITIITTYVKKQSIQIQITNPKDPLILYLLDMTEIEFHQLKSEQNVIIGFQEFPSFLVQMLEMCYSENNTSPQLYYCILHKRNTTDALLIIQQRTQFREVNHLILNIQQAGDMMVKKYLGLLSSEYKLKYESSREYIEKQHENIDSIEKENNQLKDSLQKEKLANQIALDNLLNEKNKEINELKEKNFIETKQKLDELESINNKKIDELEGKLSEIQLQKETILNEKKRLDDIKLKLEINQRDLEGKYSISNTELSVYKEDIVNLRQENSVLNQKIFKQEKDITELTFTNNTMQKQLEEKERNITNLKQLVDTLTKQHEGNDDNMKSYKLTNNKLEEKLQTTIAEINKGNDIIEKLQAKIKEQKSERKAKQQTLETQEQLISQKQILLDEQIRLVNESKRSIEIKELEVGSLNKQIMTYQQKLQENERLIEENKNMIMYLNQKLNDNYSPFKNQFQGQSQIIGNYTQGKEQMNMNFQQQPQQQPLMNTMPNSTIKAGLINDNYPLHSIDPMTTSKNNFNNDNMQSSSGSAMFIMPETNFSNYKYSTKIPSNSNNVNLLNHKYGGMMGSSSMSNNQNNLDGSGSISISGMRTDNNNTSANQNINNYNNMEEEYPRQMAQPPQRSIYPTKK